MDGNISTSTFIPTATVNSTNETINISNGSTAIPTYGKDAIKEYFVQEYNKGCSEDGFYQNQLWSCFDGSTYAFALSGIIIAGIGLFGNIVAFLKIVFDKKLHSDIFVALACVLVSDTMALISYSITGYVTEVIVLFDMVLVVNMTFIICTTMWSCLNAILLTVVRYRLQKETNYGRLWKKIIVSNVIFFFIGMAAGVSFTAPLFIDIESSDYSLTTEYQQLVVNFSIAHLYLRLAMTSFPLIPSFVLHFMRLSIRNNFYYVRKSMAVVITIMLTLFNLACLQEVVLISVYLIWGSDLPDWLKELTTSSEFRIFRINPLPWIINFSIKPLLLIFVTPPVKACLGKTCCCFF